MKAFAGVFTALLFLASLVVQADDAPEAPAEAERETLERELAEARDEMAEAARRLARLQRRLVDLEGDASWREVDPESIVGEPLKRVIIAPAVSRQTIRPRLGLLLGPEEDIDRVIGVTPGSGAEQAGLRRGDRLVAINGQAIDPGDAQSVQRAMEGVEAGDSVSVEIERDGALLVLEVEASEHPLHRRTFARSLVREGEVGAGEIEREVMIFRAPDGDRRVLMSPPPPRMRGLDSGSQLVSNNPDLSAYFGTGEGVIVLKIEPDNDLDLVSGDVILEIDGEPVGRPIEVGMALMRSRVGDTVTLKVMRSGAEIEFEATVPDGVMPGSWSGGLR